MTESSDTSQTAIERVTMKVTETERDTVTMAERTASDTMVERH